MPLLRKFGGFVVKPAAIVGTHVDNQVWTSCDHYPVDWKRRATRWSQKRVEGNPLDGLEASPRPRWPVSALASARFVTISLAHALTGYTVNAIETKIKRGVWVEGREWRRAPDGRVLIDMRGYERWVESQNCATPTKRAISA